MTLNTKKREGLSLFLLAFIAYTVSYFGRNTFASCISAMAGEGLLAAGADGLISSAYLICYGSGQLINGFIGDYIRGKSIISGGLLMAALVLFLFPTFAVNDDSGVMINVLWCFCGYFLSMLWGPMNKIIVENLPGKSGTASMTSLNVASITGTMLTYAVCAVFSARHEWQGAFYFLGVLTLCGAVTSYVLIYIPEKKGILADKKEQPRGVH